MVWPHAPSKVQLLVCNRILSVTNFLVCYDSINYSFLGKKRTGMRQTRDDTRWKDKYKYIPFFLASLKQLSFHFNKQRIRRCKIVCNYVTITVHLPWVSRAAIESHESHPFSLIHFVAWILTWWEKPCWISQLLGIRDSTLKCVDNGVNQGIFSETTVTMVVFR